MKERLNWIMSQLDKLNNDGYIRYEGNPLFQGAKMELQGVIDVYQAPAEPVPVIEQVIMSADQVAAMVADMRGQVADAVRGALEQSDVEVLAAINAKGDDVIAALTPAEPAPTE